MRWLVNLSVGLMIIGIAAAVLLRERVDSSSQGEREDTRGEVRRFQKEITLRAALGGQPNALSHPATVDATWFDGNPPINVLLSPEHPWVEVASFEQRQLEHPPDRVAASPAAACFWYNPYLGIVRARVPLENSDMATLELYNFVNGAALGDLFAARE